MGIKDDIYHQRYKAHGEETWEKDSSLRIGRTAAQAEAPELQDEWTQRFHQSIASYDFIPGGRIIVNAGKPKPYMMNCNCIDVDDSRESIGEMLKDILVISGTGGGVGVSFSKIRPKGAPIQTNGGESSGTISFMHCADQVAGTIKTGGGRRAALMMSLSVYHPDILDFLHEKLDLNKLQNANISVEIDDKFIDAVNTDADWDLVWAGKTYQTIKAKEIWNILVKNALASGEPGILNMGHIRNMANSSYFTEIVTTNPCQPETSLFLTKDRGIVQLKDIGIGDTVWTGKQWSPIVNKWSTGVKPVYRYTTSNGYYTECTENHRVVQSGVKTKIKDANHIDKAICTSEFSGNDFDEDLAVLAGLIQGDGSMQKNGGTSSYLNIGKDDGDHEEHVGHLIAATIPATDHKCELWRFDQSFSDLNLKYSHITERTISDFWMGASSTTMKRFLKGLYSANGSILESAQRVTLKSSNKTLIQQVQIMLSALGIRSYYTTNKAGNVKWDNGTYCSKESYDLNITSDINTFAEKIGFTQKYKTKKIRDKKIINPQRSTDIIGIEHIGDMEVFDYTVEADEHTVWQGGLHLSNCGELPLPAYSACCLGSINVANFAREKYLDVKGFKQAIETGVRFLDDIITVNEYPLERIKLNATSDRRIGLGIMGLHYAMLKLGIKYSSDEGVAFVEKVYEILRNHSYWTSAQIASEKGSFSRFDKEKFLSMPFIKALPSKIRDEIREKGMRNVCLNTQAPTGTTSLLAGTSSGIEPIFAPVYERKYKSDGVDKTEIIADEMFALAKKEGRDTAHFESSHDISPEAHLKVQEAAQRYIDSAISKTINLPRDFKQGELSALMLKYIPGLKGVTIYKEGAKEDQPLTPLDQSEYDNRTVDAEDIGKRAGCTADKCDL